MSYLIDKATEWVTDRVTQTLLGLAIFGAFLVVVFVVGGLAYAVTWVKEKFEGSPAPEEPPNTVLRALLHPPADAAGK